MSSSRYLSDLLTGYLKYTEDTEPPKSYHTWCAISMIAGAMQRRLFFRWGHDLIYPNMYVILVGPSGHARKGTAMKVSKEFLRNAGVATASESVTREALIKAMVNSTQSYSDDLGKILWHCSISAVSEELAVFLEQSDIKFLAALTDWYDCHDIWKYETKGGGVDKLQGVCFNLLGGTAPDWLSSIFPEEALGGGFTSRCIFVVEERKGKTVPKPSMDEELGQLIQADLEHIMTLSGEMTMTPEAENYYIKWYESAEEDIKNGKMAVEGQYFSGYCSRRATHIRKLAMVLSISRSDDLIITLEDMQRADKVLTSVERNMSSAFHGLGRSQYSRAVQDVLQIMARRRKIKRSDLLKMVYKNIDSQDLKVVKEILQQMKVIRVIISPTDGEEIYEYLE